MAKKYYWEIAEDETDFETGDSTGNIITHKLELTCSYITGKAIITIDGSKFNISEKPFSLKGTEQMFKLGSMPALLSFKKKGTPTVTIDNEEIAPK